MRASDRAKLADAELFLGAQARKLTILDEVQHLPQLFPVLRSLVGHPMCGPSWEGFVLENVLAQLPSTWRASHFRTAAQAEIDLVLEGPRGRVLAIEVKRSLSPVLSKGFHHGFGDVAATAGYVVTPAGESFPLAPDVRVVPLRDFVRDLPRLLA
jgi:uncharacterized protein